MDEKFSNQNNIYLDDESQEETEKVSLFAMLSNEFENLFSLTDTSVINAEVEALLQTLTATVIEFISAPKVKWKSREYYRHIRTLQKIQRQHSANAYIKTEIDNLINKLNLASFDYYEDIVQDNSFTEEELYWTELALQEDDPSYLSHEDMLHFDYMRELSLASFAGNDQLNDLRYERPVEFNRIIAKATNPEDFSYWHHIDELIENDVPIEVSCHDDNEDSATDKIQADPNFAHLDTYRNSLMFLDDIPDDTIKVVFWQSDFEKFVRYCSDNNITTMLQLFDKNLSELYPFGFNFARISQISETMEAWAEKILNPDAEDIMNEPADENDYDDFLSMFFNDSDEELDEDNEDDLDDEDYEDIDNEDY